MTAWLAGLFVLCFWLDWRVNTPGGAVWPVALTTGAWFLYGVGLSVWGIVRALAGKAGVGGLAGIRGLGRESAPPKGGAQ